MLMNEQRPVLLKWLVAVSLIALVKSADPTPGPALLDSEQGTRWSENMSLDPTKPNMTKVTIVHAALEFTAWGVLAPTAIIIALFYRDFKHWLSLHRALNTLTVISTLAALPLANVSANGHFITPHEKLGMFVTVAAVVQSLLGFYIHYKYNPNRTHRPVRNWIHRVFGGGLAILGLAAVALGFAGPLLKGFYGYIGLLVLSMLFSFISMKWRLQLRLRHEANAVADNVENAKKGTTKQPETPWVLPRINV